MKPLVVRVWAYEFVAMTLGHLPVKVHSTILTFWQFSSIWGRWTVLVKRELRKNSQFWLLGIFSHCNFYLIIICLPAINSVWRFLSEDSVRVDLGTYTLTDILFPDIKLAVVEQSINFSINCCAVCCINYALFRSRGTSSTQVLIPKR